MNTLKTLMFGVAFLATATAAQAAECNLSDIGITVTPEGLGAVSDARPAEIVARLYGDNDYRDVKAVCSQEQVLAAFTRMNGSTPIGLKQPFKLPVLTKAVSEQPKKEEAKPAATAVAETQPVPKAKVEETPELKQAKAKEAAAERKLAAVQKTMSYLPAGVITAADKKQLEDAKQDAAAARAAVTSLEAKLALKADITYVDEQLKGKANVGSVYTKKQVDDKLKDVSASAWTWWDWAVAIAAALAFIGAIVACLIAWFRKPSKAEVGDAVEESLKDKNLALPMAFTRIGVLEQQMESVNRRFNHAVVRVAETPKPADLKVITDDTEFDYPLLVDGNQIVFKGKVVQHTQSGEAIVKIDELKKPVSASALFKSLADFIEDGGVPALRAVNN